MFTTAGFNNAHHVVARARIAHKGHWPAKLIAFEPSGDLCWHVRGHGWLIWEAQAVTHPHLDAVMRQALSDANRANAHAPYCVWQLEHDHSTPWPARKAA